MDDFQINPLRTNSVAYLFQQRDQIEIDPHYQRQGGIWNKEKKQLLIDSVINGFDIPKIYFHEFLSRKEIAGKRFRYAIIDGKQRMQAIWGFQDNEFPLAGDFIYLEDESLEVAGLYFDELADRFPDVAALFNATPLPIIVIRTGEIEFIEEMFSRLNEAAPLNAAEKRNALGGPVPFAIRELVGHDFFVHKMPSTNRRYRHYDLAAKFLLWVHEGKVVDVKKVRLDGFARQMKDSETGEEQVSSALTTVRSILDRMSAVFVNSDQLLARIGFVSVLFLLFFTDFDSSFTREDFQKFEESRILNRTKAEEDISEANYRLIEFDQHAQSPNDGSALSYRLDVLRDALRGEL